MDAEQSKVDGYFVRYDCYKDGVYFVTRIVRFRSKSIANARLKLWNKIPGWSYRNITPVKTGWMMGSNKVNHLDYFHLEY